MAAPARTPTLILVAILGYVTASRIQPERALQKGQKAHRHVQAHAPSEHVDAKQHSRPTEDVSAKPHSQSEFRSPVAASLVQDKAVSSAASIPLEDLALEARGNSGNGILGKVPWQRPAYIVAIGIVLAAVLCCTCCLMERCLSAVSAGVSTITVTNADGELSKMHKTASDCSRSPKDTPKKNNKTPKSAARLETPMSAGSSIDSGPRSTDSMQQERKQQMHEGRLVYEWNQSPTVARVYINVPTHLKKTDLEIVITSRRLAVGCKGKPPFLSEETYAAVDTDGSVWRLRSNGELQIHMKKEVQAEWKCVLLPPEGVSV